MGGQNALACRISTPRQGDIDISIRRGSGLFISELGVWRCLVKDKLNKVPRFLLFINRQMRGHTWLSFGMFSKGRSNARTEIDSIVETIESMINAVEAGFNETINSLKVKMYDILRDEIPAEEKADLLKPYEEGLKDNISQLNQARNKLVISIYSICEASLAGICQQYNIEIKKKRGKNYYLKDYVSSLGINLAELNKDRSIYIVLEPIRNLRNYLTHSNPKRIKAKTIVKNLNKCGIADIVVQDEIIVITNSDVLRMILRYCDDMLHECELIAQQNIVK